MKTLRTHCFALLAAMTLAPAAGAAVLSFDGTLYSQSGTQGSTIDRLRFSVLAPGTVTIDVLAWELDSYNGGTGVDLNGDGEITFFDSVIKLYRDDGSLGADGSTTDRDSFLELSLSAGDYLLAIGPWHQFDGFSFEEVIAGVYLDTTVLTRLQEGSLPAAHDYSDYRVTITGDVAAVPLPGALGLFAPAGLTLLRRRRKSP